MILLGLLFNEEFWACKGPIISSERNSIEAGWRTMPRDPDYYYTSNTDEKLMMMQQDDVTTGDLLQLGEIWGPATPSEQTLNFPNSLVFYTINKGLFFSSQEC